MANWYTTLEAVKRQGRIPTIENDVVLGELIESHSRTIDRELQRRFIPLTATRLYRWPQTNGRSGKVYLDADLLAVTTLQTKAQDTSPTTISSADFFLEPNNDPPYYKIEIDLSSASSFEAGNATSQRSISVAGRWGFSEDTQSTGTVASGLSSDATATEFVCSNGHLIGVGDTLLIESEQVFVSAKDAAALGSVLVNDASITAAIDDTVITLDGSHGVLANEVIRLDTEHLKVLSVSGNNITVIRAYDGTTLATHNDDTAVHVFRTLTIERGANGTTAATHANATAISRYVPPIDITQLCIANVLASYAHGPGFMGRNIGGGESQTTFQKTEIDQLRKDTETRYRRRRWVAV